MQGEKPRSNFRQLGEEVESSQLSYPYVLKKLHKLNIWAGLFYILITDQSFTLFWNKDENEWDRPQPSFSLFWDKKIKWDNGIWTKEA